jgi:hypothetical protein
MLQRVKLIARLIPGLIHYPFLNLAEISSVGRFGEFGSCLGIKKCVHCIFLWLMHSGD